MEFRHFSCSTACREDEYFHVGYLEEFYRRIQEELYEVFQSICLIRNQPSHNLKGYWGQFGLVFFISAPKVLAITWATFSVFL